mmetsp:Transcript_2536/g.5279  ORF Transcript_2536/g.5279 Transcript_2536/m.5279 type:complete len:246 (-) Transcript_2536:97-834(-)
MVNLEEKFKECGITRVLFIRHAQACPLNNKPKTDFSNPHDWKLNDQTRPLTDGGKVQAENARRWFIEGVGLSNNKVLVGSGARRAVETLQIMAETRTANEAQVEVQMIHSLHPAGIALECEKLFDRLNYGPLTKYYAEPNGERALAEYGQIVLDEFCDMLQRCAHKPGNTISMFGHAVFLNAAAMEFAKCMNFSEAELKALTEVDLGEAEGLSLTIMPDGAKKLQHMHCRGLAAGSVTAHPLFSA